MHRVTSRQRLFSWDHFDASPPSIEEDDQGQQQQQQHVLTQPQTQLPNFIVGDGDDDNDDDDQSDYKTCCMSMSRHGSMLFNQQSFGCMSNDDDDDDKEVDDNDIDNDNGNSTNKEEERGTDADNTYNSCHTYNITKDLTEAAAAVEVLVEVVEEEFKPEGTTQGKAGNNPNDVNIISDIEDNDDDDNEDDDHEDDENYSASCESIATITTSPFSLLSQASGESPSPSLRVSPLQFTTPTSTSVKKFQKKEKKLQQKLTLLFQLNRDVQYHVLSFLDLQSLRSTSLSCRYLYALLTDTDTNTSTDTSKNTNTELNEFNSHCSNEYTTETVNESKALDVVSAGGGCARNAIWWNAIKLQWPCLPLGDHCDNNIFLHTTMDSERTRTSTPEKEQTQEEKQGHENGQLLPPFKFSPYMVQFTTTCSSSNSATSTSRDTSSSNDSCSSCSCGTNTNINYGTILTQSYSKQPPTKIDSSFFESTTTTTAIAVTAGEIPLPIQIEPSQMNLNRIATHRQHHGDDHNDPPLVGGMRQRRSRKSKLFASYTMNVNRQEFNSFSSNYIPSYEKVNDDKDEKNFTIESSMDCSLSSSSFETLIDSESFCKFEVVQYIGRVGVGDRSIRSDEPFPRPLESLPVFKPEPSLSLLSSAFDSNSASTNTSTSTKRAENCSDYFMSRMVGRKRALSLVERPQEDLTSPPRASAAPSSLPGLTSPMNFFDRLRACHRKSGTVGAVLSSNQHQPSNISALSGASMSTMFANGGYNALFVKDRSKSFLQRNSGVKLPFVSPMVTKSTYLYDDKCPKLKRYMQIDFTPRMMAYFEVSILPRDEAQEKVNSTIKAGGTDNTEIRNGGADGGGEAVVINTSACVAIGLSMEKYSASTRMPGWDEYSYGYHGDDGGIFHSRGDMIRVYGPNYNVGDTVGCGVNYLNGGIFFTLNGDFLGYAWCNEKIVLDGRVNLYPTIGVDSPNPLACNFGNERPFVWDFPKFMARNGSI